MSYNVLLLKSDEDCDLAKEKAEERKKEIAFAMTLTDKDYSDKQTTADKKNARLIEVNALIAGTTTAISSLSEGKEKKTLVSKLRRLNDRRDNLLDNLSNEGGAGLLDAALEVQLLQLQLAEIDKYIDAVNDRKAAL